MQTIGIGVYRKKDYSKIRELSEDRDNMDDTWEEWEVNKKKAQQRFEQMGVRVVDVLVKPTALVEFCQKNGLRVDGSARGPLCYGKGRLMKEVSLIDKAIERFMDQRRPPEHIRDELDLGYTYQNQVLEIFEIRPYFLDKSRNHSCSGG